MTTYTVAETGRRWAPQNYNRTTRRWLDGGPDLEVEIHDDDSGRALADLTIDELLTVAGSLCDSEHADVATLADAVAEEIDARLDRMVDEIDAWDGESAQRLAVMLNDADQLSKSANDALRYVPGRPYGYDFEPGYDIASLGWHHPTSPIDSNRREDAYASDHYGVLVVLVAGTTDDGWTTGTLPENDGWTTGEPD